MLPVIFFFDLYDTFTTTLACNSVNGSRIPDECENQEIFAKDLVVNKLQLEVDSRFSSYAMCNLGQNGTDGFHHACADDEYCCFCENAYLQEVPCSPKVGAESILDHFGGNIGKHCTSGAQDWECWKEKVVMKMTPEDPGYWYSTLKTGYCGSGRNSTDCAWRVLSVDKIVNRSCHATAFGTAIQAHGDSSCFTKCARMYTDCGAHAPCPCWARCFYQTILGPNSGQPGGNVSGLSLDAIITAWLEPFETDVCPGLGEL